MNIIKISAISMVILCSSAAVEAADFGMSMVNTTVEQGSAGEISFTLACGDNQFIAYQFDLKLPKGVVIPQISASNDYLQSTMNRERSVDHIGNGRCVDKDNNIYRFSVISMSNAAFTGADGVIMTCPVNVTCDPGVYEARMYDILLSRSDKELEAPNATATITVTEAVAPEVQRYGDNQLYVKDIKINQGENAVMQVGYNSLSDVHEYSVAISLPAGVTVGAITYGDVLTAKDYETTDSFDSGVLTLKGEQTGTAKKPKPAEGGDHVFANVVLNTSALAPGEYQIVAGKQYLSNEDDENDGEYSPENYIAILTVTGSEPSVFELADGEAYTASSNSDNVDVTYTRTFNNTEWQPLYVPFNMSYDEWNEYAEVAQVHNVRGYDNNNDGEIDDIVIEFNKVSSGEIVPNIPYVIKAKNIGEVKFECNGKRLLAAPAEEGKIECSSTTMTYSFHGVYQSKTDMFSTGAYHLSGGSFHQAASDAAVLPPYRFYLEVTPKTGGYIPSLAPQKIRMMVNGDDDVTSIEGIGADSRNADICHDLMGRRVVNPAKGIYIKNGRKVLVK